MRVSIKAFEALAARVEALERELAQLREKQKPPIGFAQVSAVYLPQPQTNGGSRT